jgi:hypothetical protein
MASIWSLKNEISKLGVTEREELLNYLDEVLTSGADADPAAGKAKENTGTDGEVCPYCGRGGITSHAVRGKNKPARIYRFETPLFSPGLFYLIAGSLLNGLCLYKMIKRCKRKAFV